MISIQLNGEEKHLEQSVTLFDLLKAFQISSPAIAIAVNSEVVPRSAFEKIRVRDRDRVEIIHPVGGG